jgi:hypothetical protein
MSQINHLIESGAEKIVGGHQNFPQFLSGFHAHYFNFSGIPWGEFPVKTFCPWASLVFCRADYEVSGGIFDTRVLEEFFDPLG